MNPEENRKQIDRMEAELDSWRPSIRYIPLGWPPDGEVTQDDLGEDEGVDPNQEEVYQ